MASEVTLFYWHKHKVFGFIFFKTFGPHHWIIWKRLISDGHGQAPDNFGLSTDTSQINLQIMDM